MASFAIDNVSTPFAEVWIHHKIAPKGDTKPYEIVVLPHEVVAVFDPEGCKPLSLSWPEFIARDLGELGTGLLISYVHVLMELSGEKDVLAEVGRKKDRRVLGVLGTVDEIVEDNGTIRLRGRIEEWCPEKYA